MLSKVEEITSLATNFLTGRFITIIHSNMKCSLSSLVVVSTDRGSETAKDSRAFNVSKSAHTYSCCDTSAQLQHANDEKQLLFSMKLMIAKQKDKLEHLSFELNKSTRAMPPNHFAIESVNSEPSLHLTKSPKQPFPMKLYALLELASTRGFGSASTSIVWLPHGRAFKVVYEQKFMESIVPLFFRQTKIRSFYRQLSLWGFKR